MLEKSGDSHIFGEAAIPGSGTEALPVRFEPSCSRSDLLARMSHEMRTPLSAILGFAQLIESGSPPPTLSQKRSIDRILQAGWYLEKLINMTRDLALIESGLSLSLQPVALASAMLDCQATIEPQAQIRGVRVTFPRFESPCPVSADRVRLQEVLANFLSAAIDYAKLGTTIVVSCEMHGAEWIRVAIDGGEGLSARQPLQPFDRHKQKAAAADGTAIGLLLARRLVGLMGGTIDADGVGATFSFNLKRVLVPMAAGNASNHSTFGASAPC